MPLLEWSPALVLDIPEIDRADHLLVDLMVELERASLAGAPYTVLQSTFQRLGEATQRHFTEEEALMERLRYPELAQHKIIHAGLLEKFGAHFAQFRAKKAGVDPEVFKFLAFWLRAHICGVDKRYADHRRGGMSATTGEKKAAMNR